MIPFKYVEFYDVPRYIALHYRGRLLLLKSAFDEAIDEYPENYSVYVLPESAEDAFEKSSWNSLDSNEGQFISQIRVNSVEFDATKRQRLNPSCLNVLSALEIESA